MSNIKIVRLGIDMRNRSGGVVAEHKYQEPLRVRLTDIPHLQISSGLEYLRLIVNARKGDHAAIAALKAAEENTRQQLWSYRDNHGATRLMIKPGLMTMPEAELIWHPGNLPRQDKVDSRPRYFMLHYWPGIDNSTTSTLPISQAGYNKSFSCPNDFKSATEGFIYANYRAIAWQMLNHLSGGDISALYPGDVRAGFVKLFRDNNIRNILDLGCGSRADFLTMFLPVCREARVHLYGLNLGTLRPNIPSEIKTAEGKGEELEKYFGDTSFDLIVTSGVLGAIQLFTKSHEYPRGYFWGTRRNLWDATRHSLDIATPAVARLSNNPLAAMFIQSFSSFFLMKRSNLECRGIEVPHWNNEEMKQRQETPEPRSQEGVMRSIENFVPPGFRGNRTTAREKELFRQLWQQGANVAVLTK